MRERGGEPSWGGKAVKGIFTSFYFIPSTFFRDISHMKRRGKGGATNEARKKNSYLHKTHFIFFFFSPGNLVFCTITEKTKKARASGGLPLSNNTGVF